MAFTLIHEERITHSGNGLQIDDDFYIKLDAAFVELLPELARSGELPALLDVQLREAYASSGKGTPATLKTIQKAAICQERQARRIVKSLLEKCLIAEAGLHPETGEKFYRPIGYAWFGNRRQRPAVGVSSMTPQDTRKGVICHGGDTVVVDDEVQNREENPAQQTTNTRAYRILKDCGIFGKPLTRLAQSVSEETAQAWKTWLENPPKHLRNPVGVVVNALLADPDAKPAIQAPKAERKAKIVGKLAQP
jgi:hypothetical protein